jgi:hypothetical protein
MIVLSYSNIDIIQGIIGYGNASEGITDWRISNTSNATFNIFNSSSELSRFSILDNGNVGIGTTPSSTSSLLEISGDVNISGIYKKNNIDIIQSSSNYVTTTSNFLVNRIVDEVRFGSNYVDRINNELNTRINDTSNYILSTSNILVNLNNSQWTSTSSGIYYNQKIQIDNNSTVTAFPIKTARYMVFPYTTDYSNVAGVGIGQSLYTINIPTGGITCDILMVGGGGAGGKGIGPGGGGGAVLYGSNIYIPAGTSNIIVGRGAIPGEAKGKSTTGFNAIILGGGSAGNDNWATATLANSGGSGAGGKSIPGTSQTPGAVIPSTKGNILTNATLFSGNIGGYGGRQSTPVQSAGGGGAGSKGGSGGNVDTTGHGGNGVLVNITGQDYYWGGGGGGGSYITYPANGGLGGGGAGETRNGISTPSLYGVPGGSAYTRPVNINGGYGTGGGGGGAGNETQYSGYGGSGIVIIKYLSDLPFTLQNTISSIPEITPTVITEIPNGFIGTDKYMIFSYTTETAGLGTGQTQYIFNVPTQGIICDILMVGGGGAGGKNIGGGGGGGAVLYGSNITIPNGTYSLKVGRGAIPGETRGKSTEGFNTIIQGGGSASDIEWGPPNTGGNGYSGGSGGGGKGIQAGFSAPTGGDVTQSTIGNILISSTTTIYNGNIGGSGTVQGAIGTKVGAGGGGGTFISGNNADVETGRGGNGGDGIENNILGTSYWWGAGGGGSTQGINNTITSGNGGKGGGGAGSGTLTYKYMIFTYTTETAGVGTGQTLYPVNIPTGGITCDILMVGGGGAGGKDIGAGGGGGGVLYGSNIYIPEGTCNIKVGRGAILGETIGKSTEGFGATIYGGGSAGDATYATATLANSGGSGAGGKSISGASQIPGVVTQSIKGTILANATLYGNIGGTGGVQTDGVQSAGGGGAGSVGGNGNGGNIEPTGHGGDGVLINILGSNYYWGGGGGGGSYITNPTNGGLGGGGAGERKNGTADTPSYGIPGGSAYTTSLTTSGAQHTGGGGGGSGYLSALAGNGGSGIVIIRYLTVEELTLQNPTISYQWIRKGTIRNIINNVGTNGYGLASRKNAGSGTGSGGGGGGAIVTYTPPPSTVTYTYMIFRYTTDTVANSGQTTYTINVPTGGVPCDILIVGGGGGGGYDRAGGGGAGGLLLYSNTSISAGAYTIRVGKGGVGATSYTSRAENGGSSSFSGLSGATALGGGRGANAQGAVEDNPNAGGSGGGGAGNTGWTANTGGLGTSGQGNKGGNLQGFNSGGGGGAGSVGGNGVSGTNPGNSGNGGIGLNLSSYFGTSLGQSGWFAGGGGGALNYDSFSSSAISTSSRGGQGGGGNAGLARGQGGTSGSSGTGGGGGGGANIPQGIGGAGGTGIVIVRYPTSYTITLTSGDAAGTTTGTVTVAATISDDVSTQLNDNLGGNGGSGIIIIRYRNIQLSANQLSANRLPTNQLSANVGIGTTNPQTELHVYDDTTNNTALTIQNNYNDPVVITPNTGYTITETIENNKYYRTLTFSHFPNYPSDPPNTSLLAWYRFNGDGLDYNNSPIKYDLSANTGPGPVYSSGTGVDSFFQGRRYINTATGSLKSTTLKLNSRTFSVSVWLRTKNSASFTSIGPFTTIVSNGNTATTNVALWLGYRANNAYAIGYCNNDLYCGAGVTGSPTSYLTDLNTWVHIVYVVLANYNRRIYRNGILIATDSITAASTGLGELSFGVDYNNNSSNINVDLSDLRVYNKGLAPPEVSTLYYSYSNLVITDDYTANFTNPTELSVNGTSKTASGLYNISIGNLNSSILPAMGQLDIPLASTAVTTVAIKYNYNQNMLPYIYYGPGVTSKNVGNLDAYTAFTYTGIPSQDPNTTYTFTTTESYLCDILIIGGGGAGGQWMGGGGGAGGVVYAINQILPASTYQIKVGRGGIGTLSSVDPPIYNTNLDGIESSLMNNNGSSYISFSLGGALQNMQGLGGGGGGTYITNTNGRNGGSGGGCSETNAAFALNIAGFATQGKTYWNGNEYVVGGKQGRQNTTSVSDYQAGGGGGLGILSNDYRNGNNGVAIDITGTSKYYAAGGGAGQYGVSGTPATTLAGLGGIGGGGNGRIYSEATQGNTYLQAPSNQATSGIDGTGSGGGGGAYSQLPYSFAGSGGSGIVIIRYRKLTSASFELINNNIDNSEFVIPGTTIKTIDGTLYKYILFPYTVDSVGLTGQTQYTFNINSELTCDILLVGGGGGGGGNAGSGGGGDVIEINNLKLPVGIYTIIVGSGGIGGGRGGTVNSTLGENGKASIFSGVGIYVIAGGGGGGWALWTGTNAGNLPTLSYFRHPITDVLTPTCGGVGGTGGDYNKNNPKSILYSPSGSGGTSDNAYVGGAGGGAAPSPLGNGSSSTNATGGSGGKGISSSITGTSIEYGGGGGAGSWNLSGLNGGGGTATGGGGYEQASVYNAQGTATASIHYNALNGRGGGGTINKDGGSGIVIIRYMRTDIIGNNYKIGNYNGEFKIISNNIEHMRITENGASIYNPTGSPLWSTVSDRRIKENIEKASYDKCYDNINKLELCRFNYINELNNISKDYKQLGYIAQDVKDIFPKAVSAQPFINKSLSIPNLLSIDISQINYSLYGAVKKLIELDNNKEKRIKKMEDLLNISTSNICNLTHDILNTSNVSELSIDTSNVSELSIDTSNINSILLDTSNINSILLDTSNVNDILLDTSNINSILLDTSNINSILLDTSNINSILLDTSNVSDLTNQ